MDKHQLADLGEEPGLFAGLSLRRAWHTVRRERGSAWTAIFAHITGEGGGMEGEKERWREGKEGEREGRRERERGKAREGGREGEIEGGREGEMGEGEAWLAIDMCLCFCCEASRLL